MYVGIEFIIIIYFIFIIGIGIYAAFQIKNPSDYYVAGKKGNLISVSGSLLATILGGSAILGTIDLSQNIGWAALWFLFCAALGLFMLVPLSKHVQNIGEYTLPDLLGSFYGKKAETISSIIIPLAWLGIVAAQIIAASKILNGLGLISYNNAAILSGFVFIAYTLLGGQLSILKTDTLQAILIVIGLIALVFFSINNAHTSVAEPLKISSLFNASFSFGDLLILVLTYSVTFTVGPDIYSRIFCAKNEKVARQSVLLVAFLLIILSFALTYLGISSQNNNGIISFAAELLPHWAYGLFIAALLSAVMSSADTTLLTSSIIVSKLIVGDLEQKKSLKLTRFLIIFMGGLSLLIALYITSIIQALLLALAFFSGAFVVPILAGLLNLKVNKKHVVWAILGGGLLAISGKLINIYDNELMGNCIIISAYIFNLFLLFYRRKRH